MSTEALKIQQGSILPCSSLSDEAIEMLQNHRAIEDRRGNKIKNKHFLLVLSQDCDIANANEQYIEVILASKRNKAHKTVTKTINTRKLQLPVDDYWLEMEVENISIAPKSIFEGKEPSNELSKKNKDILLTWRINRYTRSPLPHGFNIDFLSNYLKAEGNALSQFLEDHHERITDLYVYVEPDDDEDAEEYLISVTALLERTDDPVADVEFQEQVDNEIRAALRELHDASNRLHCLQIDDDPLGEPPFTLDLSAFPEDFTFEDALYLKRLTVDYLCFPDEEAPDTDE